MGGDEYPDSQSFLRVYSRALDWVNAREQDRLGQTLFQVMTRNAGRLLRRFGCTMSGAWHGNDTCWRMALDLGRILHHADSNGRMCESPTRRNLSLIDGIVAGEGDGPLAPRPADAGVLVFGDDVAVTDRVAARLMGFDLTSIPLVREAFRSMVYGVTEHPLDRPSACVLDGTDVPEDELTPILGRPFAPPSGWGGRLVQVAKQDSR
jgi:hypothetical protein